METLEKIVHINFEEVNEYVPENGFVIRDMRLDGKNAIAWIQKQNYLN